MHIELVAIQLQLQQQQQQPHNQQILSALTVKFRHALQPIQNIQFSSDIPPTAIGSFTAVTV
jgi:hypothetical protein